MIWANVGLAIFATTQPMVEVVPRRRLRATASGIYPTARAASKIRARVSALTDSPGENARETDETATPARWATARMPLSLRTLLRRFGRSCMVWFIILAMIGARRMIAVPARPRNRFRIVPCRAVPVKRMSQARSRRVLA
jgi:hypothetical protein